MHALEFEGAGGMSELRASDRPTIPVPAPRESGVRLKVSKVAYSAATVDVVLCDLSRDPRSESYVERPAPHQSGFVPKRCGAVAKVAQNESPPSTSIVRALK